MEKDGCKHDQAFSGLRYNTTSKQRTGIPIQRMGTLMCACKPVHHLAEVGADIHQYAIS